MKYSQNPILDINNKHARSVEFTANPKARINQFRSQIKEKKKTSPLELIESFEREESIQEIEKKNQAIDDMLLSPKLGGMNKLSQSKHTLHDVSGSGQLKSNEEKKAVVQQLTIQMIEKVEEKKIAEQNN